MTRHAIIQAIVGNTLNSGAQLTQLLNAGAAPIHENVSSLEAGIFVRENADNVNAIFVAAKIGNIAVMRILLSTLHAGDAQMLSIKSTSGSTPLHEACSRGDARIVRLLLEKGADVNVLNKGYKSALYIACSQGYGEIVYALLNTEGVSFGANKGTLLNIACQNNHINVVEALLASGVDANTPTITGMLPLCVALTRENAPLAGLLLVNGANADLVMPGLIETMTGAGSLAHLRYCLELTHPLTGLPALNVNYKDDRDCRLIDKAADYLSRASDDFARAQATFNYVYANSNDQVRIEACRNAWTTAHHAHQTAKDFLVYLRNHGSVEPQNQIGIPKLDLKDEKLDGYAPNKTNVVKLVALMYEKYPLVTEAIDRIIAQFKAKNFDGMVNGEWWYGHRLTIPEVIDAITGDNVQDAHFVVMGRNMHDRIPAVDCKKMIATVIQIVEANPSKMVKHDGIGPEMVLSEVFTTCLMGLSMCNLGKLLNIMACVQDVILETTDEPAPHAEVDLGQNMQILERMLHAMGAFEGSTEALVRYVYDITGNIQPEKWHPGTTKLHGLFNAQLALTQRNVEVLGSEELNVFKCVLGKLSEYLNPGMRATLHPVMLGELNDALRPWVDAMNLGTDMVVSKLFREALEQGSYNALVKGWDVYATPLLLYGNFQAVSIDTFRAIIGLLPHDKHGEFMELLETCTLGQEVQDQLTADMRAAADMHAETGIIGVVEDAAE